MVGLGEISQTHTCLSFSLAFTAFKTHSSFSKCGGVLDQWRTDNTNVDWMQNVSAGRAYAACILCGRLLGQGPTACA